jgi:HD-GYP domain-containing protein (c-di-GMP phosphodiesterase class II)
MNDGNQLNSAVRWYIGLYSVVTAALLLLVLTSSDWSATRGQWIFAALLVVAIAVAQQFPVHLTSKTKVYVDTALITAAALALPPVLAVATVGLPAAIHELRQRISLEQGVFNVAQTASYVLAGSWIVHALSGTDQMPEVSGFRNCAAVAIGLVVMHMINTAAVATVVALQLGRKPLAVWREGLWVDMPEHLVLVTNGVLFAAVGASYPWLLPVFAGPLILVYLSLVRGANLRQVSQATIEAIADLTDLLSGESPGHARRVADLTHRLALELGVTPDEADIAARAAQLHEVGILRSDPDQPRAIVGRPIHVNSSHAELLERLRIADSIRHQQERWDGSGAPDGQMREEIPLAARLMAVADAFDQLTSPNDSNTGLSRSVATGMMEMGSGREWDPTVVEALTRVLSDESPHSV